MQIISCVVPCVVCSFISRTRYEILSNLCISVRIGPAAASIRGSASLSTIEPCVHFRGLGVRTCKICRIICPMPSHTYISSPVVRTHRNIRFETHHSPRRRSTQRITISSIQIDDHNLNIFCLSPGRILLVYIYSWLPVIWTSHIDPSVTVHELSDNNWPYSFILADIEFITSFLFLPQFHLDKAKKYLAG